MHIPESSALHAQAFYAGYQMRYHLAVYTAWLMNRRPSLVVANLALAGQGAY